VLAAAAHQVITLTFSSIRLASWRRRHHHHHRQHQQQQQKHRYEDLDDARSV